MVEARFFFGAERPLISGILNQRRAFYFHDLSNSPNGRLDLLDLFYTPSNWFNLKLREVHEI